jgi:hypothetical protein
LLPLPPPPSLFRSAVVAVATETRLVQTPVVEVAQVVERALRSRLAPVAALTMAMAEPAMLFLARLLQQESPTPVAATVLATVLVVAVQCQW